MIDLLLPVAYILTVLAAIALCLHAPRLAHCARGCTFAALTSSRTVTPFYLRREYQ
jgi:hypothetical protein